MKTTEFMIDGIRYVWCVSNANKIAFYLEDCNYKVKLIPVEDAAWDWEAGAVVRSFDVTGICKSPIALFRRVSDLTIEWIKTYKPEYFMFETSNSQKFRIYRKLVDRFAKQIPGYQVVENGEEVWFYLDKS